MKKIFQLFIKLSMIFAIFPVMAMDRSKSYAVVSPFTLACSNSPVQEEIWKKLHENKEKLDEIKRNIDLAIFMLNKLTEGSNFIQPQESSRSKKRSYSDSWESDFVSLFNEQPKKLSCEYKDQQLKKQLKNKIKESFLCQKIDTNVFKEDRDSLNDKDLPDIIGKEYLNFTLFAETSLSTEESLFKDLPK